METKRLSALLEEVLSPNTSPESSNDEYLTRLSLFQNKVKFYQACGLTGLRVLLKAEKVKKSDSR